MLETSIARPPSTAQEALLQKSTDIKSSIFPSVTMQSIGNASSNMARLSYSSTSSCDSYSAYNRSKAGKFSFFALLLKSIFWIPFSAIKQRLFCFVSSLLPDSSLEVQLGTQSGLGRDIPAWKSSLEHSLDWGVVRLGSPAWNSVSRLWREVPACDSSLGF